MATEAVDVVLVSAGALASAWRVDRQTVYHWCRTGKLPARRVEPGPFDAYGKWLIRAEVAAEFAKTHGLPRTRSQDPQMKWPACLTAQPKYRGYAGEEALRVAKSRLEHAIKEAGGVRALARQWSMPPSVISDTRNGSRPYGGALLDRLGMYQELAFVVATDWKSNPGRKGAMADYRAARRQAADVKGVA